MALKIPQIPKISQQRINSLALEKVYFIPPIILSISVTKKKGLEDLTHMLIFTRPPKFSGSELSLSLHFSCTYANFIGQGKKNSHR